MAIPVSFGIFGLEIFVYGRVKCTTCTIIYLWLVKYAYFLKYQLPFQNMCTNASKLPTNGDPHCQLEDASRNSDKVGKKCESYGNFSPQILGCQLSSEIGLCEKATMELCRANGQYQL